MIIHSLVSLPVAYSFVIPIINKRGKKNFFFFAVRDERDTNIKTSESQWRRKKIEVQSCRIYFKDGRLSRPMCT